MIECDDNQWIELWTIETRKKSVMFMLISWSGPFGWISLGGQVERTNQRTDWFQHIRGSCVRKRIELFGEKSPQNSMTWSIWCFYVLVGALRLVAAPFDYKPAVSIMACIRVWHRGVTSEGSSSGQRVCMTYIYHYTVKARAHMTQWTHTVSYHIIGRKGEFPELQANNAECIISPPLYSHSSITTLIANNTLHWLVGWMN